MSVTGLRSAAGLNGTGTAATVGAGESGRREAAGAAHRPVGIGPGHLGLQPLPATVEVTQLALEVRLEPGAVLALELLELLDVLLQRRPLGVQAAHGLLVPLARVPLEGVRLGASLA